MEQLSLEVEALKVEESRLPAVIDESREVLDVHLAKKNEKSSRTPSSSSLPHPSHRTYPTCPHSFVTVRLQFLAVIQENESKKMATYQQAQDKIEQFYERFLGLTFEEIPSADDSRGGLRFVFTLVNPDSPAARYEFCLAVNESYKYDCMPTLSPPTPLTTP